MRHLNISSDNYDGTNIEYATALDRPLRLAVRKNYRSRKIIIGIGLDCVVPFDRKFYIDERSTQKCVN